MIRRMRSQHRHRPAAGRHRFGFGEYDLVGRHAAGFSEAVEHAIARGACRRHRAIRPSRLGRLRQRHEQSRFGKRQPPRLLAEIGERGGADALDIAAVRREIEIERKDIVFAQRPLDLDRAHDLAKLGCKVAIAARLQKPRHLHRQCRTAGLNASAADELQCRAEECERIDAAMRAETLILIRKQHGEEARIDIGHARGKPPAALRVGVSPQQAAVAIDDAGRERNFFAERRRAERGDPPRAGAERREAAETNNQQSYSPAEANTVARSPPRRRPSFRHRRAFRFWIPAFAGMSGMIGVRSVAHFAGVTSTLSVAVRP